MSHINEYKLMGRSISQLVIPVLIEQFFIVIMGVVNTMLASNLGPQAISAIGMVDSVSFIAISIFSSLAVGGTVVVAQYTGRGDRDNANRAAAQALTSTIAIVITLTLILFITQKPLLNTLYAEAEANVMQNALSYMRIVIWSFLPLAVLSVAFGILRGAGDTKTPMQVSITMNLLNLVLSYILIYGLKINFGFISFRTTAYGIGGAAAGITLARTAGMMIILIPLLRGSREIQLSDWKLFRLDLLMQKRIFLLGVPAGAEALMFNGGKLILQTFIVGLGTASIAANAITNSVNALILIPGNAVVIAATTLVGQLVGKGEHIDARKHLKFLLMVACAAMLLLSIILLPLLGIIIGMYTDDVATTVLAHRVLVSSLIAQPILWATAFILPGGLRGAGDVRYTMIVSIISMWVMRIILGYIFAVILPLGILGIWLAMYCDWIVRSTFFGLRMRGNKWLQKSIID